MRTWSNRELNKLRKYYPVLSMQDMVKKIPNHTDKAIKSKAKVLGILKTVKHFKKYWKDEEVKFLKDNYSTMSSTEIAKKLNRPKHQVKNMIFTLGIRLPEEVKRERSNHFKKGCISFNKGKKQSEYMSRAAINRTKATRFKKGQTPHNTLPDGMITVRNDKRGVPYQYIKVPGVKKMVMLHIHLWKKHYKRIPKGKIIVFKDKNTMNCTIENLEAITRYENMMRNTIQRYPVEIKQAIRTISKLNKTIENAKEQN